jgi:ribosomal protein S27AE
LPRKKIVQDNDMPKMRADLRIDGDQLSHSYRLLGCPKCGQKLADVEHLHGIALMRFKCRRCGTYIKAELVGAD